MGTGHQGNLFLKLLVLEWENLITKIWMWIGVQPALEDLTWFQKCIRWWLNCRSCNASHAGCVNAYFLAEKDAALGKSENIRILVSLNQLNPGVLIFPKLMYKVIEVLAGGGCALVEWRLETGRTHQIRAHAKYLGVPLLGDDVYGGTKNMALSLLQSRNSPSSHGQLFQLVSKLERPCLHALSLGFKHPRTGEQLHFSQVPPLDFVEILDQLRNVVT